MSSRIITEPAAIVAGSGAYLLSRLLRSPSVLAYIRNAGWLHTDDFGEAVHAIHVAARAWETSISLPQRENARANEIPGRYHGILTVEESAEELSLSLRRVQELARSGRIAGRRVGRRWELDRSSVIAYRKGTA